MIGSRSLTNHQHQGGLQAALLLGGGALAVLIALSVLHSAPGGASIVPGLMVVASLLIVPAIWRWPPLSVYLLLFTAVALEEQALPSGFSPAGYIPLFQPLESSVGLPGLALNPIELLTSFGLVVAALKYVPVPGAGFRRGPLFVPFGFFMALVAFGVVRGIMAGGDGKVALWGIRGLSLMFLCYLLTANVIRERRQARVLFHLLIAGLALKGALGLWRFAVDVGGNLGGIDSSAGGSENSLLPHEDSFFLLLAIPLFALTHIFHLAARDRKLALFALVIALLPFLANQRRVAVAAVLLVTMVLLILLLNLGLMQPRKIIRLVLLAAFVLPAYGFVAWNSSSIVATPVQAVKSSLNPSEGDASSDEYRDIENENLRFTAKQSPLLGIGFGLPMRQAKPLPDISDVYTWYLYLPHNGFLWLGMTLGLIGLGAFAYLIMTALLKTLAALRATADGGFIALYCLSLLTLGAYLTWILFDQGLNSQRIGLYMGIQLGLLSFAAVPHRDELAADRRVIAERASDNSGSSQDSNALAIEARHAAV